MSDTKTKRPRRGADEIARWEGFPEGTNPRTVYDLAKRGWPIFAVPGLGMMAHDDDLAGHVAKIKAKALRNTEV